MTESLIVALGIKARINFRPMRYLFLFILLSACASRPEPTLPDYVKRTKEPPFKPPEPSKKNWDWVQLTSDEWLKGEIKFLRDYKLEIDSDEMDLLSFEWRKIKVLKSPRYMTLLLENQSTLQGPVMIKDDKVVVKDASQFAVFPREHLLTIVPGGKSEKSYWSGKLGAGLTVRAGNTDQVDANLTFRLRRRAPKSRFDLDYLGNYGTVNDEQTVNNQRLTSSMNLYFSRRWFATPIALELYSDPFQNIDVRITPLAGVGYYLFKKGLNDQQKLEWDVSLLGGYRLTRFDSGEDDDGTTTIAIMTGLDWDITPKLEWEFNYDIQIGVPDTSDTNMNVTTKLCWDIWRDIDFDLTLVWNFVGKPRDDADGNTPLNSDIRLIVGLGWEW